MESKVLLVNYTSHVPSKPLLDIEPLKLQGSWRVMDETDMVMTKSGNSGVAAMAMIAVKTPSSKCRFEHPIPR